MKKGELIAEFAKRTEMSGAAANGAVNTIIDIITERLKKGDTVGITGFGTFSVAKRAARKGRNPSTGAAIKIAASKSPKFSAGATLKAAGGNAGGDGRETQPRSGDTGHRPAPALRAARLQLTSSSD